MAKKPAKYQTVQGLVRGLSVLVALNRTQAGAASVAELSATTSLHRTTVKRLLETLRASGYVRYLPEDNVYRMTFGVQLLSEGFRDEVWLCDVARPIVRELTERILWPCSVVMLENDHLVVRESTHQISPLSFHSGALGSNLPLLRTAAGRAYLAFCSEDERKLLLEMLSTEDGIEGELARDSRAVQQVLDKTRERGYAVNEGDWIGSGRFGALAVPIRRKKRVLGCLDTVFSKRAIKLADAEIKYIPEMLTAARAIERKLAAKA